MSECILLAFALERGKLLILPFQISLQLHYLHLQFLLGGLGSCGSVLRFLECPAK